MADIDVAVFVKGGGNDRPAMLPVKIWKIRSAAEKGHAERRLCNDHNLIPLFTVIFVSVSFLVNYVIIQDGTSSYPCFPVALHCY